MSFGKVVSDPGGYSHFFPLSVHHLQLRGYPVFFAHCHFIEHSLLDNGFPLIPLCDVDDNFRKQFFPWPSL